MKTYSSIRPGTLNYGPRLMRELDQPNFEPIVFQRWRIRVEYSDFTDTDTSQSLNLADLADTLVSSDPGRVSGAFPDDAMIGWWSYDLLEEFAGGSVSAAALIQGISGTTNGHLTTTSVFTGAGTGWKQTPSATLWTPRRMTSDPLLQLDTTGGNIDTLEEGVIVVSAFFFNLPAHEAL